MTSILQRVQPLYCGACGMPPEYCEFGPDFETHCNPWLKKHHPVLWAERKKQQTAAADDEATAEEAKKNATSKERPTAPWTVEQRLLAFYEKYEPGKVDNVPGLLVKYAGKEENLFAALAKKYGPEPEDPFYCDDDDDDSDDDDDDDSDSDDQGISDNVRNLELSKKKKKARGVGAKVAAKVDTRVVIQKITRNKKKATTVVIGMETIEGIKLKEVSKIFSKRFAGSSSVKDGPKGKEVIIQGDHMDAVAEMMVTQFKVAGDSVYLDIDGEFVPYQ
ncbi:Translation initiation factor SUI1 [Fragilaria crotonensis]|nr:Translation initiation factor SUI1 [Fragilaria crotonensis]